MQGYSTVAGLGKTGYNLASGLGGAVTGGAKKTEETADEAGEGVKKQAEEGAENVESKTD